MNYISLFISIQLKNFQLNSAILSQLTDRILALNAQHVKASYW